MARPSSVTAAAEVYGHMGKKKKRRTKGGASTRRVKGSYLQRHKPGDAPQGNPQKKDPPKQGT